MKVSPPSIPIHLARVYGVQTRPTVQPVNPVARQGALGLDLTSRVSDQVKLTGEVQSVRPTEAGRADRIESLVAARVPGGVRFTEDGPEPTTNQADLRSAESIRALLEAKTAPSREAIASAAIPMYRNPAMKNAAAASIAHAQGSLDLRG